MKYPLAPSTYSFNAAAGTITFSGTIPADINNIMHVTNITRGVLYFQPQAGAAYSGTYSSPTLTLSASTVGHSNTDKLLIVYDDGGVGATAAKQDTGNTSLASIDSKTATLVSGRVPVDGSAVTQPVSATTLPLPTGAATSAKQDTGNTSLASLDTKSPALVSGRIPVDGSAVTQPISATALPLPTGAATDATLGSINTKIPVQGQALMASSTPVVIASNQSAVSVSAASLPLPSGASTSALQTTGNTSLSSIDSKTATLVSGRVPVDGSAVTQPISAATLPLPTGAATSAKQPALGTAGTPSTDVITVQGAATGTAIPISAASLPLPSGAATSALQTTGNTSLSSIDSKTATLVSGRVPVDGSAVTQPISAASLPLPSGAATSAKQPALGTAGTPSTDVITVQGNALGTAIPVSAASLPLPSGAATSSLQTTGNTSLASIDGKTATLVSGRVPVDGSAVTQPISATALPLPTGAATSAKQPALGTAGTPSTDVITVQGSAAGTAIPVSASSLPLPSGAATDATLSNINIKTPVLGQATMSGSVPVTVASDQAAVSIADNGLLSFAKESLDIANSGLAGMILQEDTLPDPSLPSGPALQVTLRDRVQLDPSTPAVIGGVDPTGAIQTVRTGTDGGLQLTDGKTITGVVTAVNTSPTGWIDTTGYQSIVVTFFGSTNANYQFQGTNDLSSGGIGTVLGWQTISGSSPVNSVGSPGNGTSFQIPVTTKYFRLYISSYTSGSGGTVVVLRSAPSLYLGNQNNNITLVSSQSVQGLGGSADAGALTIAGGDYSAIKRRMLIDTQGNIQIAGPLRSGFQFNAFNASYGNYTQTLTSQTAAQSGFAPVTVGGLDGTSASKPLLVDTLGATAVTSAPSAPGQQSIQELLYQILATLRASAYYQYELAYENSSRCAGDEPDNLIGDFLHQANNFNNFTN